MKPFENDDKLAEDLRALRPTPRPEFTAELDDRAAAGFPRRSRLPRPSFSLPSWSPRRMLLPAGGIAVIAIAISTALVATHGTESERDSSGVLGYVEEFSKPAPNGRESGPMMATPTSKSYSEEATGESQSAAAAEAEDSSSAGGANRLRAASTSVPVDPSQGRSRSVERSAQIVLAAEPGNVAEDSRQVFEAVHAHDGIVMSSSTREGKAGAAGARFELLIPSAKLSDALAALSEIDEVRSRHEATADITAPTVNVGELLQDSKARIDSLLGQLAEADTESEREAVEAELRQEHRHRASLRTQLQNLQKRADLARVSLRIETGAAEDSGGGTWGVDDALRDAGKILGVAAAVTLVALAVIAPIALIALLAWLAHRTWVRRERRRVLS
jgi:hypothetical protein